MKIRIYIFLFCLSSIWLSAQSNDRYSDEDLKTYIEVTNAVNYYRMQTQGKADSMRIAQELSEQDFFEIISQLKKGEVYDSIKTRYPSETILAFDRTMQYRNFLRQGIQNYLAAELERVNWDMDFYQHLALSIEAIPELRQRLTALSK